MKIAVYTSIFGKYDVLHEDQFKMEGVDYLCFTDEDLESNTWNIIKSIPLYNDPNRNAKKYKILPHRYLKDYDYSVWIDKHFSIKLCISFFIIKLPSIHILKSYSSIFC